MATLTEMIAKFKDRCDNNPEIQKRIAEIKANAQSKTEAEVKNVLYRLTHHEQDSDQKTQ